VGGEPVLHAGAYASAVLLDPEPAFAHVESQTEPGDRRSLLALWAACRDAHGGAYDYLELGSYLGGSLQVPIADPACRAIVSIDARTAHAPDVRGGWAYPDNDTAEMIERLRAVPGADLDKLTTFDARTDELDPAAVGPVAQLGFVDAEHTPGAALADARFCRAAMGDAGAIVFHDRWMLYRGIRAFLRDLRGVPRRCYPLPDTLFVVELGPPWLAGDVLGAAHVGRSERLFACLAGASPTRAAALLRARDAIAAVRGRRP